MRAIKMNNFLQRMIKKNGNEELNADSLLDQENQKPSPGKGLPTRGNWIHKLGNCSPKKYKVLGSSPTKMTVLNPVDTGLLHNVNQGIATRGSGSPGLPGTPVEMPDLESIIRDFEKSFNSPSKKGVDESTPKQQQKNFVKKIVAAFEVKYKTYNELKEIQDAEETSKKIEIPETKRKSSLFSSPFRSGSEEFRTGKACGTPKKSPGIVSRRSSVFSAASKYSAEESKAFRRSGVYGSPFKVYDDEESDKDPADESKDAVDSAVITTPSNKTSEELESYTWKSGMFSPCNRSKDSIDSDIYSSPVHLECQNSKDSGTDGCSFFSAIDKDVPFNPLRVSSLDDTNTLDSIDLDMTLPEPDETIFLDVLDDHALRKTSTAIDEYDQPKEDSVIDPPPVFRNDKVPKIIGAFLKRPIEVEDTSIDWIPITGKKLPRKRSLKKLLTSWATKRSLDKKHSLFSSERNLTEETRELQDSGYDEKSSSSSSLTSLISITEALLLQENSYIQPDRRSTFKSFRPRNSLCAFDDDASQDARRSVSKQTGKLVLTEVPREELKVDLGPVYPIPKVVTMSLNRKMSIAKFPAASPGIAKASLPRIPKHPHLSAIPKHPFVALTKLDEAEFDGKSVVIKNDLYEVEFRRSCTDIGTANNFCDLSSSSESNYDVPRKYLSKSETQIAHACEVELRKPKETIYDTPRRRCQERPKSSNYEDTLSTNRKHARICEQQQQQQLSQYYSSTSDIEPHYATVKPIYNRLYHSREMLLSSVNDIAPLKNVCAF